MRAIFMLLLVGNLIFFGYHYFLPKEDSGVLQESIGLIEPGQESGGLQLLTERVDLSKLHARVRGEASDAKLSAGDESESAEFCTMIGPYSQLLQAEYAIERLAALGVVAHITPVEIKEGESYWVYLKPEISEKEALRRLYELQNKKIESYVITKGELTNGVSFGRFANYEAAKERAEEIVKQGYAPDIKMLPKMIQETWVVINAGLAEKIDDTVWGDLLNKEKTLEKRQNFCLGVASH